MKLAGDVSDPVEDALALRLRALEQHLRYDPERLRRCVAVWQFGRVAVAIVVAGWQCV
jgi:hypothetical protein